MCHNCHTRPGGADQTILDHFALGVCGSDHTLSRFTEFLAQSRSICYNESRMVRLASEYVQKTRLKSFIFFRAVEVLRQDSLQLCTALHPLWIFYVPP
jgi:hypothetical protein